MIHDLLPTTSELLKQQMPEFDFVDPPTDPIQLAYDLAESVISHDGLGISANQLGIAHKVLAIKAEQIIVCFNPKVVDCSTEMVYLEEGCTSQPGFFVKIKRPRSIRVRYTEPNGNVVTKVFEGMTARVFLHQMDILYGIKYTSRATTFHLEQARKKSKGLRPIPTLSNKAQEALKWINQ